MADSKGFYLIELVDCEKSEMVYFPDIPFEPYDALLTAMAFYEAEHYEDMEEGLQFNITGPFYLNAPTHTFILSETDIEAQRALGDGEINHPVIRQASAAEA